jgi:hypothetical protein
MNCQIQSTNQLYIPMSKYIQRISTKLFRTASINLCVILWSSDASALVFTTVTDGAWENPCTWNLVCAGVTPSAGLTIPGPNDDVIINNRHSVRLQTDATVRSLNINNGIGSDPTTLTVASYATLRITGQMTINSNGRLAIEGRGLVYVDGNTCVKNNGSVNMTGVSGTGLGSLFIKGCVTVGSNCTESVTNTSGTPNFINPEFLQWCIACVNNNSATSMGTPGFCNLMMPVEYLAFSALVDREAKNETTAKVAIRWSTLSEQDNASYSVERSVDGIHFAEILRVAGQGNTASLVSYQEYDNQPLSGISYYRLRQTDLNGRTSFSKTAVVLVEAGENLRVSVSPVPLEGKQLNIRHNRSDDPGIQLFTAVGVPVSAGSYSVSAAPYQLVLTLHQPLREGVYLLKLRSRASIVTKKIVIR